MNNKMDIGDLSGRFDLLRDSVESGFAGLNKRVDALTSHVHEQNGRVGTLERSTDVGLQRILNLEREIFSAMRRPLTRGDVAIFVAGGAAILGAVRWLPALLRAAVVP